jgi:hypothetical protein
MMTSGAAGVATMAVFLSFGATQALRYLPEHARGGSLAAARPELLPQAEFPESSVGFTLSVPLDHFDPQEQRRFDNYFYVDDSCFDAANGPIFVEMGPEIGIGGAGCSSVHQRYGALAVALEHRFYGQSIPFDNRSTSMLRFLSVEQALADTAEIIEFVLSNRSLDRDKHPVVTFGGSYSGGTAAWFRMLYPNVTSASVSSSGVVNAIVNFTGFDEQVAAAIDKPVPGCAARLGQHVAVLEDYFERGLQDSVKQRFGATNLVGTKLGDSDFWYMVADGVAMADQVRHDWGCGWLPLGTMEIVLTC